MVTLPRAAIECLGGCARSPATALLRALGGQGAEHRGVARLPRGAELSRHGGRVLADGQLPRARLVRAPPRRRARSTAATGTRRSTSARSSSAPPGGYAETRLAYDEAIERFSPEDLSTLAEGVEHAAAQLSVRGDRRAAAPERLGRVHAARRRSTPCASRPPTPTRPRRRTCARRCIEIYDRHFGPRRRRPAVRDRPAALRDGGLRGRARVLRGVAGAARPATTRPSRTSRSARRNWTERSARFTGGRTGPAAWTRRRPSRRGRRPTRASRRPRRRCSSIRERPRISAVTADGASALLRAAAHQSSVSALWAGRRTR